MSRTGDFFRLEPEELFQRAEMLNNLLSPCMLCPRSCGVDRLSGDVGACGIGGEPLVASSGLHFGEERVLVGNGGSGTIFLAGCNLSCIFCQNYDISHLRHGDAVSVHDLSRIMLSLQNAGATNINWVTPTHVTPWLVRALAHARRDGLAIPIVYNCGGYESLETLKLLDGVIDIYLPDAKFAEGHVSEMLCNADDYFEVASRAITEMFDQVGNLSLDPRGLAFQGILVRHLVLPYNLAGSERWAERLAEVLGNEGIVNVMNQYHPAYHATTYTGLGRRITGEEFSEAFELFRSSGLSSVKE